jgi:hypothetical protein
MSTRYHLILRAEPGNWRTPLIVRLRKFLKAALRQWGLRCVDIREEKEP